MAQTMELDGGARAAEREMVSGWRRLGMSWAAIDRNLGQPQGYALKRYGEQAPDPVMRPPPMASAEEIAAHAAKEAYRRAALNLARTAVASLAREEPPASTSPHPAPTRGRILGHLRRGPADSLELAELCAAPRRTVGKALGRYREAGWVAFCRPSHQWSLTASGLALLQDEEARRG